MVTPNDMESTVQTLKEFLLSSETFGWSDLDTQLEYLEWLTVDQLCREVDALLHVQLRGEPRCANGANHKAGRCIIPYPDKCCVVPMVASCAYITQKHLNKEILTDTDLYVLKYYLAFTQTKLILS